MRSNILDGSFAIGQPKSLPIKLCYRHNPVLVLFLYHLQLLVVASHLRQSMRKKNVPFVPHTVSPNINDYYTSDANLWRLVATIPIVTRVQCCNAGSKFSNLTTVVPPCNTAAPYTSGGTVYLNTPPVHPQHVRHFVNYTNTGYQPVNEDYAPSSAYPTQACSSDRPLSSRELAELIMHSRKDHLPE